VTLNLQDRFGRKFEYLRLSLTDACNYKCQYCLPNGYQKTCADEPLSRSEILNLVAAFAELGTWKVRLTGGEPTLRPDLIEIVEGIAKTQGIRKVALSTNGSKLVQLAPKLKMAGLHALNISMDSLDALAFEELTGMNRVEEIKDGLGVALKLSFDAIKINAVLMKTTFRAEFERFINFVQDTAVSVRFIELMPTGSTQAFFKEHHLPATVLRDELKLRGWSLRDRSPGDGPAEEWSHPNYRGRMGIIAPYGSEFCASCNRLRVSAVGELRLCLFAEGNTSVRHLLQSSAQREELKQTLQQLVYGKEKSHYLPEGRYGNNFSFSSIGG
jgi:cyclic pyranopterin phosphate synthase